MIAALLGVAGNATAGVRGYAANPFTAQLARAAGFIDVTDWSDDPALNAIPDDGKDDTRALQALFKSVMTLEEDGGFAVRSMYDGPHPWHDPDLPQEWMKKFTQYDRRLFTMIYFPDGVYDVSDELVFPTMHGTKEDPLVGHFGKATRIRVIGQSADGTILRLAPGTFRDASRPRSVISFDDDREVWQLKNGKDLLKIFNNIAFSNSVENLTIQIGPDNAGACAIMWQPNNTAVLRNLRLVARGDGYNTGKYGIWAKIPGGGSGYIHHVEIDGFENGFCSSFWSRMPEYTFENVGFRNQRVSAVFNEGRPLQFREIESVNTVPFLIVGKRPETGDRLGWDYPRGAHLVLLDSELRTPEGQTTQSPAFDFQVDSTHGFIRNVQLTGYTGAHLQHKDEAYRDVQFPGGRIGQWVYQGTPGMDDGGDDQPLPPAGAFLEDGVYSQWSDAPVAQPVIPAEQVKDTPQPKWDAPEHWAVLNFDDANGEPRGIPSHAVQRFIDDAVRQGKTTVVLAGKGSIRFRESITVHGSIRRLYGGFVTSDATHMTGHAPLFRLADFSHDEPVLVEALGWCQGPRGGRNVDDPSYFAIENLASNTVILRDIGQFWYGGLYRNFDPASDRRGTGEVFMESIVAGWGGSYGSDAQIHTKDQTVWARNINTENPRGDMVNVQVDGGQFWSFGFKMGEGSGPYWRLNNCRGAFFGYYNALHKGVEKDAAVAIINDSDVLMILVELGTGDQPPPHPAGVVETRGGETRILPHAGFPQRFEGKGVRPVIISYRAGN